MKNNYLFIIPSYNPKIILKEIINNIYQDKFFKQKIDLGIIEIIIIDDGNTDYAEKKIFKDLLLYPKLQILKNKNNLGQGSSIKKGLLYAKQQKISKVLTLDDDGQHSLKDIEKLYKKSEIDNSDLIIGCRAFDSKTPLRSRIGNYITSVLIKFFFGITLNDVTSGLRCYNINVYDDLLNIESNRFDFQLISIVKICDPININYSFIPIKTIYLKNNYDSRFKPVLDSLNIIFSLLKFYFKRFLFS